MEELQLKVNINFKILPFGRTNIEMRIGTEESKKENTKEKMKPPVLYMEPKVTSIEFFEVSFES
ncbi:MAG: hypothetical protein ABIM42_07205 [candidate division WOR-3 bacterium]